MYVKTISSRNYPVGCIKRELFMSVIAAEIPNAVNAVNAKVVNDTDAADDANDDANRDTHEHIRLSIYMQKAPYTLLDLLLDRVNIRPVTPILTDVLRAVAHMHKCGLAHGDIHAGNVLLYPNGDGFTAKITDYGLTCQLGSCIVAEFKRYHVCPFWPTYETGNVDFPCGINWGAKFVYRDTQHTMGVDIYDAKRFVDMCNDVLWSGCRIDTADVEFVKMCAKQHGARDLLSIAKQVGIEFVSVSENTLALVPLMCSAKHKKHVDQIEWIIREYAL